MKKFKISFSVNYHEPFIWSMFTTYTDAAINFNLLAKFDLGNATNDEIAENLLMINAYRAYRRKHNCNHPDLIAVSYGTIDELDTKTNTWWIVSESGDDTPDFEIGESEAYNT